MSRSTDTGERKPVRIQDVADLAGVSIGTVSNVVTGKRPVTATYERRVREAVASLGYVPNATARHLRTGSSRTIGLVLTDVTNPFFADLALGAERAAADAGYGLLIGTSPEGADREVRYLDVFQRQRVDGILVTPAGASRSLIARARENGARIVMVERKDPAGQRCSVVIEDSVGAALAARHLLASGRRRLLFAGGPVEMTQMADRLAGFRAEAEAAGAALEVLGADDLTLERGLALGRQIAARPESELPDGIMAANDMVAHGMMRAFHDAGIDVPGRIALVGHDDIPFSETSYPRLTSVRPRSWELGNLAVRMLLDEFAEGVDHVHRHITVTPQLRVRESS